MMKKTTKYGFRLGDRVGVWALGTSPMYFGTVVGWGRKPGYIRIKPDHGRARETWRVEDVQPKP